MATKTKLSGKTVLDWIKNKCGYMEINGEKWVSLNEIKLQFKIDEFKKVPSR